MPQTLLITGAARGIGAATAQLAATRGYNIVINYLRNTERAEALAQQLTASGATALPIQADISQESDVQRLFDQATQELGPLTALVNNAAILETQMRLEEMDRSRFERIFATNVFGTMLCAREAVRRLSTKRGGAGGAIVNVSSGASLSGSPGEYIDYAASKGAIDTFTRGLAREVATEGIRVNALRPGFIDTEIHADGGEPNRLERVKHKVPLQRGGTPQEVAQAILWLLSPEATYVNGAILDVTGGV